MEHKEYRRIVQGANTAVVFIHGIIGTPNHFHAFVRLVPQNISVYNILLDGHGGKAKDLSKASMKKWEMQIKTVVDELLLTHKEIYIMAHSMGSLLAIEQAIKNSRICKLFLLAVPIRLTLKPEMFYTSLKVYLNKIKPDDQVAIAAKKCCGIEHSKNIFDYLSWIPRYIELFKKIRYTRKTLYLLNTPCYVVQSSKDEMASVKSIKLLRNNPAISIVELKESRHYYYTKNDFAILTEKFKDWLF